MGEPGWVRRLLVDAGALSSPERARHLANLFEALADMLRQPGGGDWADTVARADHLAAENPRKYATLAGILHQLQQLCEGPEEQRHRVAAELEDGAAFLRGG